MTFQPQRRRLLAAVALFAGAPSLLRAQEAKPECKTRIELDDGAHVDVLFKANTTAPVARVTLQVLREHIVVNGHTNELRPMMLGGETDKWGQVELDVERTEDGKGLVVTKVSFKTPYPGYATAGFSESAIAINTKPYGVTVSTERAIWGDIQASLTPANYGAAHRPELEAQLLAGTRVRLWLKENPLYGKTEMPNYAVELKSPNLKAKTPAILKAMKKVEKDAHDQKCTTVSEGCFLTTAAVHTIGLADDCWELRTLRAFRDGPLAQMSGGATLTADYYVRAPRIVEAISARPDAARVWLATYWTGVVPCALAARLGMKRLATAMYRRMTLRLERLAAA